MKINTIYYYNMQLSHSYNSYLLTTYLMRVELCVKKNVSSVAYEKFL